MSEPGRAFLDFIPCAPQHIMDTFKNKLNSAKSKIPEAEAKDGKRISSTNVRSLLEFCKTSHDQRESDGPDGSQASQLSELFDVWVGLCTNTAPNWPLATVLSSLQDRGTKVGRLMSDIGEAESQTFDASAIRDKLIHYFWLPGRSDLKSQVIFQKSQQPDATLDVVYKSYRKLFIQIIIDAIAVSQGWEDPALDPDNFLDCGCDYGFGHTCGKKD